MLKLAKSQNERIDDLMAPHVNIIQNIPSCQKLERTFIHFYVMCNARNYKKRESFIYPI